MSSKHIHLAYKIHRTVGLLVGLQIILWIMGGVVMSVIPIEMVRGNHLAEKTLQQHSAYEYQYSVDRLMLRVDQPQSIHLGDFLGQPVYRIQGANSNHLYDSISGAEISPITAELATQLAIAHYTGSGDLIKVEQIEQSPHGVPTLNEPLWQATFDDTFNTHLYFASDSGLLVSTRSDIWYFYDFFWMLHIMDYQEAEDFNHPLLIFFAITSLLFVFSGLFLLINTIQKRYLKLR